MHFCSRCILGQFVRHEPIPRNVLDSFDVEGEPADIVEIFTDNVGSIWNPVSARGDEDRMYAAQPCKKIANWRQKMKLLDLCDDSASRCGGGSTEDENPCVDVEEDEWDSQDYETRKIVVSEDGEMIPAFFIR